MSANAAHFDDNQVPTMMGAIGTLGTADTAGTAAPLPIGVNPATGAMYVQDLSGASGTTNVLLVGGTLNAGTVTTTLTLNTGTITTIVAGTQNTLGTVGVVNAGTLTALAVGTIGGKAASGAAAVANPVLIAGTDSGGTVYSPIVTSAGALSTTASLALNTGTLTTIAAGTQNTLGTVGVVNNLVKGTITALETGTLTALAVGTIGGKAASGAAAVANPVQIGGTDGGGTIYSPLVTTGGVLAAVMPTGTVTTIVAGTQNTLGTVGVVNNLVTGTVAVVSNLTNGSVNLLTGTVTRVSNVGTVESGTVRIDPVPVPTMLTFGTLGTAGGSFFATVSAASGAGTKHYVSNVDIVMQSGTADVRVLAGSAIQGTGVLAAGQFPAGGGIAKNIHPAFATGTNSELIYHFVGAGTAFITVDFWKGA